MHGKGMCPMRRPSWSTLRVHVHHQNDQDQGKFHIARLHCIFALRCVLCCPGTSESVSLRLAPECSALPSKVEYPVHVAIFGARGAMRGPGLNLPAPEPVAGCGPSTGRWPWPNFMSIVEHTRFFLCDDVQWRERTIV